MDTVKKVAYFAMEVPNKPGEAACVLTGLADAGVNLLAFSAFPRNRKAQLDFIPEDVAVFKNAVKTMKIKTRPQKFGLLVQGDDRKGAVADLLKTLAEKKINVTATEARIGRRRPLRCHPLGRDEGREQGGEGAGGELDTSLSTTRELLRTQEGLAGYDMPYLCYEYGVYATMPDSAPILLAFFLYLLNSHSSRKQRFMSK